MKRKQKSNFRNVIYFIAQIPTVNSILSAAKDIDQIHFYFHQMNKVQWRIEFVFQKKTIIKYFLRSNPRSFKCCKSVTSAENKIARCPMRRKEKEKKKKYTTNIFICVIRISPNKFNTVNVGNCVVSFCRLNQMNLLNFIFPFYCVRLLKFHF